MPPSEGSPRGSACRSHCDASGPVIGSRFIGGAPMKVATNVVAGFS